MSSQKRTSPLEPKQKPSRRKRSNSKIVLFLTCEHGGAKIPKKYAKQFKDAAAVLKTHRGLDIGALAVARDLAKLTDSTIEYATVSRLVVDLNRSIYSETLFSEFTKNLSEPAKQRLLESHYDPFRNRATKGMKEEISSGHKLIHLSVHSFTPVWNGKKRNVDLSVLYDPQYNDEKKLSDCWMASLRVAFPELRVRRNNPYKGSSDGFSRWLRKNLPQESYIPIMLELNQGIVGRFSSPSERKKFSALLSSSLMTAIEQFSVQQSAGRCLRGPIK